jgi:GGDEF domain-containing protein
MIGLPQKAPLAASSPEAPQSPLIKEAVHEAFQELLRPDTGLLSYPLFMHFMEVEFQRALRLRLPFSLLIIKVHKEGGGIIEQLSSEDLKLVAERLRLYLEPYDHIGHYEILDIGVLLPHRPSAQAREYASKFIADFNAELAQTGNGVRFVWSVGIGCIPEDGIKLGAIVSKAEKERNQTKETSPV